MNQIPSLFTGLKITNYFKYILYLSGIILILSLFLDVKGLDNSYIRHIAFWTTVVAIGVWLVDDFVGGLNNYFHTSTEFPRGMSSNEYKKIAKWLLIFNYGFHIIVWIVLFVFLFL